MSAKSRGGVGRKEKKVQGAADERAWGVSDTRQRVRGSGGLVWAERGAGPVLGRRRARIGPFRQAGESEVVGPVRQAERACGIGLA